MIIRGLPLFHQRLFFGLKGLTELLLCKAFWATVGIRSYDRGGALFRCWLSLLAVVVDLLSSYNSGKLKLRDSTRFPVKSFTIRVSRYFVILKEVKASKWVWIRSSLDPISEPCGLQTRQWMRPPAWSDDKRSSLKNESRWTKTFFIRPINLKNTHEQTRMKSSPIAYFIQENLSNANGSERKERWLKCKVNHMKSSKLRLLRRDAEERRSTAGLITYSIGILKTSTPGKLWIFVWKENGKWIKINYPHRKNIYLMPPAHLHMTCIRYWYRFPITGNASFTLM